jgi:hypothetical protein
MLRTICTGTLGTVLAFTTVIAIPLAAAGPAQASDTSSTPCTPEPGYTNCVRYGYTAGRGAHLVTVPAGVTSLRAKIWGAGGGGGAGGYGGDQISGGGAGGFTAATLAVTPGSALGLLAGEGGQARGTATAGHGGGTGISIAYGGGSGGGSGGGLSGIFRNITDNDLGTPLLIAGGGGGAGGSGGAPASNNLNINPTPVGGGGGGGLTGTDTVASPYFGLPGTQIAGGSAGTTADPGCPNDATSGSWLRGGTGGGIVLMQSFSDDYAAGGGGGGGYFGGGGGACAYNDYNNPHSFTFGGPGGGGSGYLAPTGVTDGTTRAGSSGGVVDADAVSGGAADPLYDPGIGKGGEPTGAGVGGNGEIVLEWATPVPARLPAAVVTASAAAPALMKIVTQRQTLPLTCKLTVRKIGRCLVTMLVSAKGKNYVVGTADARGPGGGIAGQLLAPVTLNALGHYLAAFGTVNAVAHVQIIPFGSTTAYKASVNTRFVNFNVTH